MAAEGSEGSEATGAGLRGQLEAALNENATLRTEVAETRASKLISEKGYKYVTPSELKGFKLDEIEAKAAELEQTNATQAEAILRRTLESKGYSGSDLDNAVTELLGPSSQNDSVATLDRIRSASRIQGTPPSREQDPTLLGPSKIRASVRK